MGAPLSPAEMQRWVTWKRAADTVWGGVVHDLTTATGLSAADFSVLTRVVEDGGGRLRQQRLCDDLGWDRPRLSRQLARMEERGLVRRDGDTTHRTVGVTAAGRRAAARAREVHADAVRRRLLARVTEAAAGDVWTVLDALADDDGVRTEAPVEAQEARTRRE